MRSHVRASSRRSSCLCACRAEATRTSPKSWPSEPNSPTPPPRVGKLPATPLVPMTYAALLEAYGWEEFAADAREAGATSLIVADLPAGERPELPRVQLVAPTSTDERLRLAADQTDGWLYLVAVVGTTGPRADVSSKLPALVERARRAARVPLYAGFGISTPGHARATA